MNESQWIDRAQSAEAKLSTMEQNHKLSIDRVKQFKANFGVRERDNGEIDIDFQKLVERLSIGDALELRRIIDEIYSITGEAGEKPHIRMPASAT